MHDVYSFITETDPELQRRLADVTEPHNGDHRQRAMLEAYLTEIEFPEQAVVLEIGCGTGPVTRRIASWPGVGRAVGIDPSEMFIARARELNAEVPNLTFVQGDGRDLAFESGSFDVVILHTTLSHVREPERVLMEAMRVLKEGGCLAVFEGDYASATVSTGAFDPLEQCVQAFRQQFVHDPWLVRRLPRLLEDAGFVTVPMRSHGYVEAPEGGYMLTWIDRGASALVQAGRIAPEVASALQAEARRRAAERAWFGHITFASLLAEKPHRS